MKKIPTLFLLTAISFSSIGAGELGESWARLYSRVFDINQKLSIMQNIVPLDDPSLEGFLSSALDDLVYGDLSQYRSNRATYDVWEELTRTVVKEIGDIKAQSAVRAVWDLAKNAETPLLKAQSMVSLGELRAIQYAPELATMLRNINFNTRSDQEAAEIEAYGAVVALDKMKDPSGIEPMFYASIGWYQDRVTNYAARAVLTISDDPSAEFTKILKNTQNYTHKRDALRTGLATNAPDTSKASLASSALEEGLKFAEADYQRRRELALLRTEAIEALIELKVAQPETPELLDAAIEEGNQDEKLIAIRALGVDGSDASVERLSKRLESYNDRQLDGLALNQDEQVLVRQIIYSLGEAGNEKGVTALRQMAFAGYTPGLIRAADKSIAKITGN